MKVKTLLLPIVFLLLALPAFSQGNGKLQLHFLDVGQGDGAILISPGGQTVLFDNGVWGQCEGPLAYLESLGVTKIDYMIISHYHADHLGCTRQVLNRFPLTKFSYDRPGAYDSTQYRAYVKAVGNKRNNVGPNTRIILDADSENPVRINIAGYNGAGAPAKHENDRNVAAVIHFGSFDAMMAGDLSGQNTSRYNDIETTVAKRVGQMEVLKVNHHGSAFSSNKAWLTKLKPRIGIISAGKNSEHGHPAPEAMKRLHASGIAKIYWISRGGGATPKSGVDIVANGSVVIEVVPGANDFTVSYGGNSDTHPMWSAPYVGKR